MSNPSAVFYTEAYFLLYHKKSWNVSAWNSLHTQLKECVRRCLKKLHKMWKGTETYTLPDLMLECHLHTKQNMSAHINCINCKMNLWYWYYRNGSFLPSCPTSLLKIISNSLTLAFNVSSVSFVWLKRINWWRHNIAIKCSTPFWNLYLISKTLKRYNNLVKVLLDFSQNFTYYTMSVLHSLLAPKMSQFY